MKLPISLSIGKKEKPEYLLALLLRDEKATAVVFKQFQGKIDIVGRHEEYFQSRLEDAPIDEWLDVLDKAISRAEETLPADVETHKTLFGVKDEWVEEKRIRKDYLATLKEVCSKLDLTPIGFLVISEAIVHLMQEEEGAPVSALLAQIGRKSTSVSLIKAGRVLETKITDLIDENPVTTVDTILKHFNDVEVLPSRLILFNGKAEELAQDFITHQWSKSLPFLHMPQISVLPSDFDARAVVFGAAEQMGLSVMENILNRNAHEIKTFSGKKEKPVEEETKHVEEKELEEATETKEPEKSKGAKEKDKTDEHPKTPLPAATAAVAADASAFGFVLDEDIASQAEAEEKPAQKHEEEEEPEKEKKHTKHTEHEEEKEKEPEKKDHEVEKEPKETTHHKIISHKAHIDEEATHAISIAEHDNLREPQPTEHEPHPRSRRGGGGEEEPIEEKQASSPGPNILASITGLFSLLPLRSLSMLPGAINRGGKMMLIAPLVILLLIGLVFLYIFHLKATVALDVNPKPIDEEETVLFSLSQDNDFGQNILAAKNVTVEQTGKVQTATTGKKEVGDKAKGTVTLYNSADSKKTLDKGTVITSSNNLDFALEKDVSIGSASGDIFSGTKPGTAQVTVIAQKIGKEYNLPSNTKFSVGGQSSIAAKNDSAFSGGSKKEVTVVDKKDIAKLEADLPKSLQEKAKEELMQKLGEDEELLPTFSEATLANKKFDRKEGVEAKVVNLNATVEYIYFVYNKNDVKTLAQEVIKTRFGEEGNLSQEGITTTVSNVKKKDEKEVEAKIKISGGLMPKLDTAALQKELAGKSFEEAEAKLKSLPQVDTVTITFSPPIPFLPETMPRMSNNITITINADE